MRFGDFPKGLRVGAGYGLRPVARISQRVQQRQIGGTKLLNVESVERSLNGCVEGFRRHGLLGPKQILHDLGPLFSGPGDLFHRLSLILGKSDTRRQHVTLHQA